MIKTQFVENQNILNRKNILKTLDIAFEDKIYSKNTKNAFFNGYKSSYPNFIVLNEKDNIAGVCIISTRQINLFGNFYKSLTFGPLCIAPDYQKKGLSKLMMSSIDKIAKKLNCKMIYVQGIKNFYSKFEYFPCLAKSKIVINIDSMPREKNFRICNFTNKYLSEIRELHSKEILKNNLTSLRSKEDWNWLLNNAKETFYFFDPKVILYNNKILGYFCTDPQEKNRLREVVIFCPADEISIFLSALRSFCSVNNLKTLQLMTPTNSKLYNYFKLNSSADFIKYIRKDAGQLLKILDYKAFEKTFLMLLSGNSNDCTLKIEQKKENIIFKISSFGKTKKFSCNKKHVPGLLSGYFEAGVLFNDYNNKLAQSTPILKPFIYQGDNY